MHMPKRAALWRPAVHTCPASHAIERFRLYRPTIVFTRLQNADMKRHICHEQKKISNSHRIYEVLILSRSAKHNLFLRTHKSQSSRRPMHWCKTRIQPSQANRTTWCRLFDPLIEITRKCTLINDVFIWGYLNGAIYWRYLKNYRQKLNSLN